MRYLERTIVGLLMLILMGLAVHTPVTVWIESNWPDYELLAKAWKELVLGLIMLLLAAYVGLRGLYGRLLRDKFVLLILAIAALHVVLLLVVNNAYISELSGLLIDLRYYLFFIELYIVAQYMSWARRYLLWMAGVGVLVVVGFGFLQATVLPRDILEPLGYSKETIQPYLTVDLNDDYVRINSTLRGPNPVGAFAVISLALLGAWVLRHWRRIQNWQAAFVAASSSIAVLVVLWGSHSRSAWLAVVAAVSAGLMAILPRRTAIVSVATIACVSLVSVGALLAFRDNPTISNLFFHSNPTGGSAHKSDDGHLESLEYGVEATLKSPAGSGIGSTGSASLHSESPTIVENQYFFFAHESGWFGLVLQVALFGLVLAGLWRARQDWLSLGLFASGVGLALIGILQPVWADDVVSLYWWGLAGLALGSSASMKLHEQRKARARHKKTA